MRPLFGKILGKSIKTSGITGIRLVSNGMSSQDCFSIDVEKDLDEYRVTIEKYPEENSCRDKITSKQWRVLMNKIDGHSYVRIGKRLFKPEILDGGSCKCTITGDGTSPEREIALVGDEFFDLKRTIERFVKYKDPQDVHNIVRIEIVFGGDMEGASSELSLGHQDGKWLVSSRKQAYNGAKEEIRETETDWRLIDSAIDIIKGYEWREMKDLPPSEIQVLDAGSKNLVFSFEPFDTFSISDTQELTEEAMEMWGRLERLLNGALK